MFTELKVAFLSHSSWLKLICLPDVVSSHELSIISFRDLPSFFCLCVWINQEACAVLLENSLHYIQTKFLCNPPPDPQAARHYSSFHFSSPVCSLASSAHTSPFLVHRLGLVIDGRTLAYALDKSLEDKFLAVARSCRSVLCCRSTPLQKSMVVKLVRNKLKVMTLAIGNCCWI